MAYVTPDKYSPYPRVCDICGRKDSINTMRKLDGITWVCQKHTGERTKIMLDTLNAHARPPQTWPNEDPKPQNPLYPNILDASEAVLFNFIDQQITNAVRYERVVSGDGSPVSGQTLNTMGWSARYLYDLILEGTRPQRYITRAKALLATAAAAIYARQRGFGLVPASTRANDAYWGGVLESGASTYVTDTNAACGLALLYAYRVAGTLSYLVAARGMANYLRNVQSIGRYAVQYTSSDSGGTARLYTGSLVSEVSTFTGVDPGATFYSTHLFYPSALLALEFWNELKTTDGDQTIGCTSTGSDAFISSPAQLLSTSISDLRACWTTGITDSTATLVNGLSATTPREFFNAYPATKVRFSSIAGTGRWEFADGAAATGTTITGSNFATALMALYNYEGASTQVTAVDDWLRSFTSNEDLETPDDTSTSVLARTTTGEYDPTSSLATLLTVRNEDSSYAAIKVNGSSLYDWGAFGMLSKLWAARHKTSFMTSRVLPLNINQRYQDGKMSDGLYFDYTTLRGLSGLTSQTGFSVAIEGAYPALLPTDQGANLQWDEDGIDVSSGQFPRYDYFVFTTIDDSGPLPNFPYIDAGGGVFPFGGLLRLVNSTGSDREFQHGGSSTATELAFSLITSATTTVLDGEEIFFVFDAIAGVWQQVVLTMVNDAVKAAQYGRAFRESRS